MLPQEKKYYTPQEYLEMEESAQYKSEYYNGEIFAMAGGSINHSLISSSMIYALYSRLKDKPCKVFTSDVRILVKEDELYTYPDISVVCNKIEFAEGRNDTITNPILIVEVLSESTKNYDRGEKFKFYRNIESLQDYILIDQYSVHIEYFTKLKDGKWMLTDFNDINDVLKIESMNIEIPIKEIYNKVEF